MVFSTKIWKKVLNTLNYLKSLIGISKKLRGKGIIRHNLSKLAANIDINEWNFLRSDILDCLAKINFSFLVFFLMEVLLGSERVIENHMKNEQN